MNFRLSRCRRSNQGLHNLLEVHLTDVQSDSYYSSASTMDSAYLDNYGGLLLMFILAAGLAGVLIIASTSSAGTRIRAKKISPTNAA